jgi:hypothetical protein
MLPGLLARGRALIHGRFRKTQFDREASSDALPKGSFPAVVALPCVPRPSTGQDASGTLRTS